ncbi:hypothetical protein ED208_04510 [Stagnimonas aquatica]|uniref:Uncharacterized protein n=1 Tax=Stagnimonas aquatica TaxID=2689987 RepID=A0A3N0VM34_9GAMM|nr:hypothetical protein [Stagnimonas aquatica]ROH93791.1 hypothetical protein ED208_04510 [Stagnimonas aquatica]
MTLSPSRRWPQLLLAVSLQLSACAYLRAQPVDAVANPELDELSGLSRLLATDDWLWGHNDSGDRARLFRVGFDGSDGGVVEVPGAKAVDWEDIAAFSWRQQPALLIGDIGDNYALRRSVSLYAVADPGANGDRAPLLWSLQFRYPDGPRDAEGLAVDPVSGDILILSKRERPPKLYRLAMPSQAPEHGQILSAEPVGTVLHLPKPTPADLADDPKYGFLRDWPTALDLAPDGSYAVVGTYKDAYLYRRQPGDSWAAMFARPPQTIDLPQWRQTEAGTISADGRLYCAGSEQRAGFACLPLPAPPIEHPTVP